MGEPRLTIDLNKIARIAGYRRSEDLWPIESEDELYVPNFIHAPEFSSLKSEKQRRIYSKLIPRLVDAAEDIRRVVGEFVDDPTVIKSEKIRRYVDVQALDVPRFEFAFGNEALELLRSVGLEESLLKKYGDIIDENTAILIYELPKPLAQYWFKRRGVVSEYGLGEDEVNVYTDDNTLIPWGDMYREVTPIIWRMRDEMEYEDGLGVARINDYGDHMPRKYYYVWVIKDGEWIDRLPEAADDEFDYEDCCSGVI